MLKPTVILLAAALPLAAVVPAWAQYKVVDPDGRVTYTDRPPTSGTAKVTEMRRAAPVAPDAAGTASLPADLRQVAQRYPVVLYSTIECSPCDNARQMLQQRGIPFTERKVASDADVQAAERALGWRTMPSVLIGAQPLRGYTPEDWTAYLDAAGYPKESRLPRNWHAPTSSAAPAAPPAPPPPPPAPEPSDTGTPPG